MATWAIDATEIIRYTFRLCFGPGKKQCYITQLTPDILIDSIFPYLLVEDLVRLRQTNKAFYLLTHEPIIWRRYMCRLHGIPVSTLRPTFKFESVEANHEIEHIVTSACVMERSWRRGFPRVRSERILFGQHLKVVDLKMVPGGKFLVASVRDRSFERFYIEVYALDITHGSRLLARMSTFYKVYDLQAKYMVLDNREGIMIHYTRRRFKQGAPPNINLAELSHKHNIDVAYPLVYEACCVHMRLDNVEALIRPTVAAINRWSYMENVRLMGERPFRDVLRVQTDFEIWSASLMEAPIHDSTCLGFIEGSSQIRFHLLPDGSHATLKFQDHPAHIGSPHRVRGFRYLPCQHGLLVVRSIADEPGVANQYIVFEFYDFPEKAGVTIAAATDSFIFPDDRQLGEVAISDPAPTRKMGRDHPEILAKEECPPTIWVFAPTSSPKGMAYWYLRPRTRQKEFSTDKTRFEYRDVSSDGLFRVNRNFDELALPGSERTLLVEIDKGITEAVPLKKLRRFHWEVERFPRLYPTNVISEPVTEIEADCPFAFRDILESEQVGRKVTEEGGLSTISWDENSGRICLSADNLNCVLVCDLAPVVEPHDRLAYKWRKELIEPRTEEMQDLYFA